MPAVLIDHIAPWADSPWDDAPCVTSDPETWFPEGNQDEQTPAWLCASCPHRSPCDTWAHIVKPNCGVWAGVRWTDHGRRRITLRPRKEDDQ